MTAGASAGDVPFGGPPAQRGSVALVGGGPGDPGLLSVRAVRLLATATVVAYDRLAPAAALALCAEGCELVDVGKLPDRHKLTQDEINALLVQRASAGEAVVRLKGGDPFVLGRGSEEAQTCRAAGVPFEVVPGVTAGIAAPAYAGVPVTHRGVAPGFAVVTGHEDPTKPDSQVDWEAVARFPGTLLVYMGVGRLAAIAGALVAGGRPPDEPTAVVEWGTTPRQRSLVAPLSEVAEAVAEAGLANPALVVVGAVAALRDELTWFERRPLHGVSVLVPRTRQQASALSERLRALGADPVEAPTIAIAPSRDPAALDAALAGVADGAYDWVALTSANGVDAVFDSVERLAADARLFSHVRVAAVGSGTAEALRARGLRADLVPEVFTTRGLAAALVAGGAPQRALLPRADIATPALAEILAGAGWDVDEVEAYRTTAVEALDPDVARRLRDGEIDVLAFASSSTVRNLVALLGGPPHPRCRIASIGPETSRACSELGLRVDAEAAPHDVDGLVAAVQSAATAR